MNLIHVVGARPNFMKLAPVYRALQGRSFGQTIVHTGQHYDPAMSGVFFDQLGLPAPTLNLEVGSGSHAEQTAAILSRLEKVVLSDPPDWVIVYGDVNSTLAASLVCAKLGIPVAHVEAGLRSFDRRMPEEINRVVKDKLADHLFAPSDEAVAHLKREGVSSEKIRLVGNVMIDSLVRCLPLLESLPPGPVAPPFALVTLHRPSNVDDPDKLRPLLTSLDRISRRLPVVFPVHPRTARRIETLQGFRAGDGLHLTDPVGYLEFLNMERGAAVVITDSGGIQEETTYLGVPCLTLRENTERPVTVELGTNILVGYDYARLEQEVGQAIEGTFKKGAVPPLWDGHAGERIAQAFQELAK